MEKDNLQTFERELDDLRAQADYLQGIIQEKEEAVAEFDKMIAASEDAYTQLVGKSAELRQALESEAVNLRQRTRPAAKKMEEKPPEENEEDEEAEEDEDED